MIPILFDSTETAFTSQGLGRLVDSRKCEVTEERNGQYELALEYPASAPLADKLVPGKYIYCTHDDDGDFQAFEIYKVNAPLEGFITVNAWHISYKLNNIVVAPFTASSCANALAAIPTNSYNTNNFTFQTDKTVSATFTFDTPRSARSLLGGTEGSILDVYGKGEYEFDMFTVKLHLNRGSNNGVVIRYGKDLKKLDYELDSSNKYNAVVPYWTNDESSLVLDHMVVRTGETAGNAIPLDLSSEWDSEPTTVQLEAAAQTYIDATDNYQVKDNLKVDFIPIWQTEEYKNLQSNQNKIKLCDTVTIYYEKLGINASAKVIKVVYDVLLDRYSLMELGEPQTTLSQQIQQDVSGGILAEVPNITTRMLSSIDIDTTGSIKAGGNLVVNGNGVAFGKNTVTASLVDSAWKIRGKNLVANDDSNNGPGFGAEFSNRSNANAGWVYWYGDNHGARLALQQKSGDSNTDALLQYAEIYTLPPCDADKTATTYYNVLTTKTFKTETKTASSSTTVAAGGTGSQTISITEAGFTPVGIVGVAGTGSSGLAVSDFYISSGNAYVWFSNPTSSSKTVTWKVNVLYI